MPITGMRKSEVLLTGSSLNNQQPSVVDTALQVEFGAAQGNSGDPVQLAADGTITFNDPDFYTITVTAQYGRLAQPQTALTHLRILLNGFQIGNSSSATLPAEETEIPFSVTVGTEIEAGDQFTMEVIRDSTGANDGGLVSVPVTAAGWSDSPSASILISR